MRDKPTDNGHYSLRYKLYSKHYLGKLNKATDCEISFGAKYWERKCLPYAFLWLNTRGWFITGIELPHYRHCITYDNVLWLPQEKTPTIWKHICCPQNRLYGDHKCWCIYHWLANDCDQHHMPMWCVIDNSQIWGQGDQFVAMQECGPRATFSSIFMRSWNIWFEHSISKFSISGSN